MCKIDRCDGTVYARDMCRKHYVVEFRKVGFNPNERICTIIGCGKKHQAKGYCLRHYDMYKLHDDPLYKYTREYHNGRKLHPKEYRVWAGIKTRCYNSNHHSYKNYGGLGVKMCDRWVNSFVNFINDMGKIPESKHSIDRINPYGDYELSNCRWATHKEQASNKRRNYHG